MKAEKSTDKKRLDIPENAPDREDYITGIGKKEVAVILSAVLVAFIIVLFFVFSGRNMLTGFFAAAILIIVTVLAVRRDVTNESLIDKMRFVKRYYGIQKRYLYEQFDFWKGEEKDDSK